MAVSDTSDDTRLREMMQEPWNEAIQTLTKTLPGILQLKYQGGVVSAFKLHPTILYLYLFAAMIYGFACSCCEEQLLPSSIDDRYLPVLKAGVFSAGSLATTLLLVVLVPVFGWMVFTVWVVVCVVMVWRVRAEVYALLRLAIVAVVQLFKGFLPPDFNVLVIRRVGLGSDCFGSFV